MFYSKIYLYKSIGKRPNVKHKKKYNNKDE